MYDRVLIKSRRTSWSTIRRAWCELRSIHRSFTSVALYVQNSLRSVYPAAAAAESAEGLPAAVVVAVDIDTGWHTYLADPIAAAAAVVEAAATVADFAVHGCCCDCQY